MEVKVQSAACAVDCGRDRIENVLEEGNVVVIVVAGAELGITCSARNPSPFFTAALAVGAAVVVVVVAVAAAETI